MAGATLPPPFFPAAQSSAAQHAVEGHHLPTRRRAPSRHVGALPGSLFARPLRQESRLSAIRVAVAPRGHAWALVLLRSACQLNNIAANGSREAPRMKSTMMDFQLTLAP